MLIYYPECYSNGKSSKLKCKGIQPHSADRKVIDSNMIIQRGFLNQHSRSHSALTDDIPLDSDQLAEQ